MIPLSTKGYPILGQKLPKYNFTGSEDDWRHRAACLDINPLVFDLEPCDDPSEAKAVCARCNVRCECLEDALRFAGDHDDYGVRGGTTAEERRALRRNYRAP